VDGRDSGVGRTFVASARGKDGGGAGRVISASTTGIIIYAKWTGPRRARRRDVSPDFQFRSRVRKSTVAPLSPETLTGRRRVFCAHPTTVPVDTVRIIQ